MEIFGANDTEPTFYLETPPALDPVGTSSCTMALHAFQERGDVPPGLNLYVLILVLLFRPKKMLGYDHNLPS